MIRIHALHCTFTKTAKYWYLEGKRWVRFVHRPITKYGIRIICLFDLYNFYFFPVREHCATRAVIWARQLRLLPSRTSQFLWDDTSLTCPADHTSGYKWWLTRSRLPSLSLRHAVPRDYSFIERILTQVRNWATRSRNNNHFSREK